MQWNNKSTCAGCALSFLASVLLKCAVCKFTFPNPNSVLHFEKLLGFCKHDNVLGKGVQETR